MSGYQSPPPPDPSLPVVMLTIEYDGTDYVGWQFQINGTSVQGVIERALTELHGQPIRVMGASRTDAGVHALAQRASFTPPRLLPMKAYVAGMNGILPPDVSVRGAEVRPPGFDARRNARGKLYRYRMISTPQRAPTTARTSWQIFRKLDFAAMREAAAFLVGEHDFSAFRAADCVAKTTRRTVRRMELFEPAPGEIVVEIEATAFLKHMVRNIVGTLAEVGMGKRTAANVKEVLVGGDRMHAGRTAPPQGLTLVHVNYPTAPTP